jgi:DmsE family decaheme c-type cytochrome
MILSRYGWVLMLLAVAGPSGSVPSAEQAEAPKAAEAPAPSEAPKPAEAPKQTEAPKLTYSRGGADTCLGCHDDEKTTAIFHGPHGVPTNPHAPFGHDQLQCEACHGPGGLHARRPPKGQERPSVVRFGADSKAPVSVQNAMCTTCHQTDLGTGWHASAHAINEVACSSCHASHVAKDPVLKTATQPDVCGTCHQIARMDEHRPYAHPIDQGKMSCTGCHSVHGSANETLLKARTTNDTCYECHADKRGPFLWEHAPVAEDCTSCHAPHGSIHSGMLTMQGPMLCKSCHSEASHPSLAPTPSTSLRGAPRAQYALGMNCLNCHSQVHGSNHPSGSALMR